MKKRRSSKLAICSCLACKIAPRLAKNASSAAAVDDAILKGSWPLVFEAINRDVNSSVETHKRNDQQAHKAPRKFLGRAASLA
jgi:hypothetical protein